jgi:hypothetical protein
MVKNNGIPIEVNKKPFQTVQELKDEYKVPSFEEFMETYEADDKVIDSYKDEVGYVNGWASKGSGPCSRSDCRCEYGERYVDLFIPCPSVRKNSDNSVSRCPGSIEAPTHWVHSIDYCRTQISNKARIQCSKSYCSRDHMKNWEFQCSSSWHNGKYHGTSSTTWIHCMTALAQHVGDDDLILDLLTYLRNPANRW